MKKPTMMSAVAIRVFGVVAITCPAQTAVCQQKFETQLNIPYADTGNPRQQLDLYLPTERGEEPLPVVAFIHGGGWREGGKGDGQQRTAVAYASTGKYAAVSIGYRLTGEASWPAQIHDCKAAIRWVRANAEKYGLNPDRIGVTGTSAGGHLVAMLGTTGDNETLAGDLGTHNNVSSRVTCVVDFFGPTELLTMGTWHNNPGSPESSLVGGTLQETKEVARQASPLTHVSKDDVPFLIIHGTEDKVVPFDQSVKFHAALKASGVDSTLLEMSGGGHGDPYHRGEFDQQTRAFFDKHLRDVQPAVDEPPRTSSSSVPASVGGSSEAGIALLDQKRSALRGGVFTKALWNGKPTRDLDRVVASSHLTGLNATVRWQDFQPQPGQFQWDAIDGVLELAEQHDLVVTLGIFGGVWTPDWAYEKHGLPSVEFTHTKEMVKHAFGRQYRVPHVWDPAYQDAFMAAVEALAHRYDTNPRVVRIFVSGPSFFFNEFHVESWLAEIMQSHGFTERKYIDGWKRSLEQYAERFPNTLLDLALVPFDGRLEPLEELINYAVAGHPGQVVFSNHSLNDRATGNAHHPLAKLYRRFAELAPDVPIGFELAEYQMSDGASFSHSIAEQNPVAFAKAIDWAVASGAWFLHPEGSRLLNPANSAALEKFRAAQVAFASRPRVERKAEPTRTQNNRDE